jgi:hypothetical protein
VQKQWREGLEWIKGQPAWRSRPRGSAAVLYEPYADGFSALEVPVYGYIKGLSGREPTDLFHALSQGTRYGLPDYLTVADLADTDLSRYSAILAPMALSLPDDAQKRLERYVNEGGVLVADIGAGLAQSGSWQALPPRLAALFGAPGLVEMKSLTGNLTVHRAHPAFPSLPTGATTTGDFEGDVGGRRTGTGAYAVNGWAGFTTVSEAALPFMRLTMSLGADRQPTFAGVVARDLGSGTALFATHRLWSSWLPEHRLFQPFHADLWARRARVELLDAPFCALTVSVTENEDGSVFLYNPGAALRLQVALYAAEHRLFEGAVCQFAAQLIGAEGLRTGGVLATVDAPGAGSLGLAATPITVRPYAGVTTAYVERNDAEAIVLALGGGGSRPTGRLGELTLARGAPQRVRLTVGAGRYAVHPGSRHRVVLREASGTVDERLLTADPQGRLTIEATVGMARLEMAPSDTGGQ